MSSLLTTQHATQKSAAPIPSNNQTGWCYGRRYVWDTNGCSEKLEKWGITVLSDYAIEVPDAWIVLYDSPTGRSELHYPIFRNQPVIEKWTCRARQWRDNTKFKDPDCVLEHNGMFFDFD